MDDYGLWYCLEADPRWPMVCGRIIIPIWFRGQYVGWQGRHVGDPWFGIPNDFMFPGMRTARILYNFDLAIGQPIVVVVKHVMDVWTIGDCAVATLGDRVSVLQHRLLAENWRHKPVILLSDSAGQAYWEQQRTSLSQAGHLGPVIVIQLPPGRDAAMYGRDAIRGMIVAQAEQAGVALTDRR